MLPCMGGYCMGMYCMCGTAVGMGYTMGGGPMLGACWPVGSGWLYLHVWPKAHLHMKSA